MSKEITGEVVQDAHYACRCLWECKIELACVEDEPN